MSATGDLVRVCPPCDELPGLLVLVRLGQRFQAHQCGKRPEFLARYVAELVAKMESPPTFERLLREMEFQAVRRATLGQTASPIEKIDREFGLLTYWNPKKGRLQTGFENVRKKFNAAKRQIA